VISLDPIVRERYASAILNIARRQNIREQLLEDARVLLEVIQAIPQALVMIEAPQFKQERKVAFLDRTIKGRFHEVIERLVYLLLERHRIEYLGAVLKRFVVLVELDLGIRPATLTTAIELTDDQKAHLQAKLEAYTKSRLNIKYVVDPSVIAGVRFRCGDLLLDDTVAWRLEIISRSLQDAARRVDVAA
jgi:F-type H+-transporting ATPase subunit delta